MTTIAIRERPTLGSTFEALAGDHSAEGRTAGEALDALLAGMKGVVPTAVLIARIGADRFFSQAQHERMKMLLERRASLSPEERDELETLIDAELAATVARTDALIPKAS